MKTGDRVKFIGDENDLRSLCILSDGGIMANPYGEIVSVSVWKLEIDTVDCKVSFDCEDGLVHWIIDGHFLILVHDKKQLQLEVVV